MHFYALQVSCKRCKRSFLVGGSSRNNLTKWRERFVECRNCGAGLRAHGGTAVALSPQPGDADGREPAPRRPGAGSRLG
jgi:RNase P subunit RPR2